MNIHKRLLEISEQLSEPVNAETRKQLETEAYFLELKLYTE